MKCIKLASVLVFGSALYSLPLALAEGTLPLPVSPPREPLMMSGQVYEIINDRPQVRPDLAIDLRVALPQNGEEGRPQVSCRPDEVLYSAHGSLQLGNESFKVAAVCESLVISGQRQIIAKGRSELIRLDGRSSKDLSQFVGQLQREDQRDDSGPQPELKFRLLRHP